MSDGDELLENLTKLSTLIATNEASARLEVLLTDFLVVTRAGKIARGNYANKGSQLGSQLAINSSFLDADDIDWSVMTHPGSVIWAALLESIILFPDFAYRFSLAASAGYRTSASAANFFGVKHRRNWHVTTTAGALASATTSGVLRNLSIAQHLTALRSTASNMGGVAVADRRTGAAIFNRAAATSLGLLASDSAANDLTSATDIWNGERGLIQLFSISDETSELHDGVSTSGLRLFPYNGFIQSLVYAVTKLAEGEIGELLEIHVGVNAITRDIANGSVGGNYWDIRHGAASAWLSKDVTQCVEAVPEVLTKIKVEGIDIPISGAEVTLKTTSGSNSMRLESAPGANFNERDNEFWRMAKWRRLIGEDLPLATEFALTLMSNEADSHTISAIREFLL